MGVVSQLGAANADALARLWQCANDRRRAELGMTAIEESAPVLDRPGSFGVGVFDGDVLQSAAVAMPARADDGRSSRNVPGLAHISSVVTDPAHWGKGLAGASVAAVMSQARRRGFARCQLWVFEQNVQARRLYERAGFELSGRSPRVHDHGDTMLLYIRELPAPPISRSAARVLCFDGSDRLLLMHWKDPVDGYQLWEPPGGGVEPGEEPLETVRREWAEETGQAVPDLVGEPTSVARDVFWAGGRLVADETFFLARIPAAIAPTPKGFTESEIASYLGHSWVPRAELAALEIAGDPVEPDLLPVLERLHA
jgi:8-oxo-dGTP pyrophosphatase MutT (NUDIX family)/GNAT superfamily N-acetyltransferase